MDESFAFFLGRFGSPVGRREVKPDDAARFTGRLPAKLLSYWVEHGFSGYADGLFWMVDPREYADTLAMWLAGTPFEGQDDYHVFTRTAFGELYVWGKKSGPILKISSPHAMMFPDRGVRESLEKHGEDFTLEVFFLSMNRQYADFADEEGGPLFARALERLGPLAPDEMYGFEPALAFGGQALLANLRRVKIIPHLQLLAQLEPARMMENPFLQE
jgi:hypothetical protein